MHLARPFRGIIAPLITPLVDSDTLDVASLERLIEYVLKGEVSGIFVLGSTGEAAGLSYRLRRDVIDRTCASLQERVPVFVGITDTASHEALAMAEHAAQAGAAGLVYAPPCFFSLSQEMFQAHLERFVPKLPLPVYLYNIPELTKLSISAETVRASLELPNVFGLKDSSGDRDYFQAIATAVSDHPEFALLAGSEEVLGEFIGYGAHGGVCGGANLYPKLYVDMCEAAARTDTIAMASLQQQIDQLSSSVYETGESESSYLRGVKCAASLLGLCNGVMAEPYQAFTSSEREEIRRNLLEIRIPGVTVAA